VPNVNEPVSVKKKERRRKKNKHVSAKHKGKEKVVEKRTGTNEYSFHVFVSVWIIVSSHH
jgi:hypothetical protein